MSSDLLKIISSYTPLDQSITVGAVMGDFDAALLQRPADGAPVAAELIGELVGAGSGAVAFNHLPDLLIGQALLFLLVGFDRRVGIVVLNDSFRVGISGISDTTMLSPVFHNFLQGVVTAYL